MKQLLHQLFVKAEEVIDHFRPGRTSDPSLIHIDNYHGYANRHTVILRGRALEGKEDWTFHPSDSGWKNFRGIARYWFTREIPFITIEGHVYGQPFSTITDEEGYFRIEIPRPPELSTNERWQPFETHLSGQSRTFPGQILASSESADRLIISDIDDTVIATGARQIWQMVKTTLLKNMHTRETFEGVSDFYEQLISKKNNPFYYVSSSPWNLRAFLNQVFEINHIPLGPAFMTDWGLDSTKLLKDGHGKHKRNAIEHLLRFHPELPCILIGDSGEKDPEIYSSLVDDYPDRISAIYIRDVADTTRDEEVRQLAQECEKKHVPLILISKTAEAIADARKRGFI